ncbi:MAG: hypothetical protein OEZ23_09970, partial [Gammaproteobacteria bacterium]|nr:hypothetical protein [Gammaproteobacteria bacterium]
QLNESTQEKLASKAYPEEKVEPFLRFRAAVDAKVLQHRVITQNPYSSWFARGEFDAEEARRFIVQFSVFSNEFLVAQLRKMLNADSLAEMRASKEILANEIGVTFKAAGRKSPGGHGTGDSQELGDLTGTVNGGTFRFRAAHFELLVRMAEHLGLAFTGMGKRCLGTASTLFFCDELLRLYGSDNYATATASSFAVENWAAAGFWDELVTGWKAFARRECPELPLVFFSWHAQIEANHAHHTREELETYYFTHDVDEQAFIHSANEMLDGVMVFWEGLAAGRPDGTD